MWWVFLTVKHRIEQRLKALDLPPGTTHWTSCTLQEAGITTNRKKKKKTRYTHWRNHPLGLCGSLQDRLYWTKKAECTYLHFRKWLPAQLCAMKRRRDCWLRKKNKCTAKITRVVALAMQWQRKHFGWVSQQSCGHGKENLLCTTVCTGMQLVPSIPCGYYSNRYNKISCCQHTANIKKALSCQDCQKNAPYCRWKGLL